MRNSNRLLIAALALAAAQLPAPGARAELAPLEQAAIQQVVNAYEAAASGLQTAIDGNEFNELQTSQNPVLTHLAEQVENAENAEDLGEAAEDFTNTVNELATSGAGNFLTAEAANQIANVTAALFDPSYLAHLKAEAARLAELKKALAAVKQVIADYQTALTGNRSTEVGSSNVDPDETARQYALRGRVAGQGALAAARAGQMASMPNRFHQPPVHRPPMVESRRITLRVEVRR